MEPLLRYCELKGYRDPATDDYGWARMCQVVGNFFGGTNSLGIMPYTTDERMGAGERAGGELAHDLLGVLADVFVH